LLKKIVVVISSVLTTTIKIVSSVFQFALTQAYLDFIERLYAKPVLTQGAENQTKLVGETVRFSCEFLTDMHPYVYWMFFNKDENMYAETDLADGDPSGKETVIMNDLNKLVTVRARY
jgi:hypothetical protein